MQRVFKLTSHFKNSLEYLSIIFFGNQCNKALSRHFFSKLIIVIKLWNMPILKQRNHLATFPLKYQAATSSILSTVDLPLQPGNHCITIFAKELHDTEEVTQRRSVKRVFSEILQNSQKNTCTRVSFLIKVRLY